MPAHRDLVLANGTVKVIRAAVYVHEPTPDGADEVALLWGKGRVRPRAVLFAVFKQLGRDSLEGLFPGAALELAFALFAHTLHGVLQASRVVQRLHGGIALGAQALAAVAPVVARDGVALDVHPAPLGIEVAEGRTDRLGRAAHVAPGVLDLVLIQIDCFNLGSFPRVGKILALAYFRGASAERGQRAECRSPFEEPTSCQTLTHLSSLMTLAAEGKEECPKSRCVAVHGNRQSRAAPPPSASSDSAVSS